MRVREAYSVCMQTDAVVLRPNMCMHIFECAFKHVCRVCCGTVLLLLSAQCARRGWHRGSNIPAWLRRRMGSDWG